MNNITKEQLLGHFSKEEENDVIRIYDGMKTAYDKNICIFTSFFCNPKQWSYFEKNFNTSFFRVKSFGGYEECDRRILSFNNIYDEVFPITYLKIANKSRFADLHHRDYLGALMSNGLERSKFGDLIVSDSYAIVPIIDKMANYIKDELTTVGRCPVEVEILNDVPEIQLNYDEIIINVSSIRLDNIVAQLAHVSRSKAVSMIDSNSISVDYVKIDNKSYEIQAGQKITILGKGKFVFSNILGNTKSGKYKINIKKYT